MLRPCRSCARGSAARGLAGPRRTGLPSASVGVFSRPYPSGIPWCEQRRLPLRCSTLAVGSSLLRCWRGPSRWMKTPAWWRSERSSARSLVPARSVPSSRTWPPTPGQRRWLGLVAADAVCSRCCDPALPLFPLGKPLPSPHGPPPPLPIGPSPDALHASRLRSPGASAPPALLSGPPAVRGSFVPPVACGPAGAASPLRSSHPTPRPTGAEPERQGPHRGTGSERLSRTAQPPPRQRAPGGPPRWTGLVRPARPRNERLSGALHCTGRHAESSSAPDRAALRPVSGRLRALAQPTGLLRESRRRVGRAEPVGAAGASCRGWRLRRLRKVRSSYTPRASKRPRPSPSACDTWVRPLASSTVPGGALPGRGLGLQRSRRDPRRPLRRRSAR